MRSSDAILSVKPVLMSSGGTQYNDLYYSLANSSVSLLECTFGWQNILALPSLQFGSSSQINIPIDQFIGDLVLHLRLPNVVANQSLARGWGYAIIQSIAYTMGNSNTTQIVLQNDAIFQTIMSQINDPSKRQEYLELAGSEVLAPLTAPAGGDIPYIDAYVHLPFPMSTACGDKGPIDSTMLQSNIVITIQFNANPNVIYGGTGTIPTSFLKAELMLKQGKLSNQAASVRNLMVADPALKYSYPFIHTQYFQSAVFNGARESDGYQACSVDLNAFSNADLVGIVFYVINQTDKYPVSNNTPNPFNADPISNILVTFNGSTLYNLPYQSYRMTNMLSGPQNPSYYPYSVVAAGNVNPFVSNPVNSYMCFLDFSRERGACIGSHLFNVFRLPNQILRVQFNTSLSSGTQYRLYATYLYNAIAEFQNGTSLIRID